MSMRELQKDIADLRIETIKNIAAHGREIEHIATSMGEANSTMADCVDQMKTGVEILTKARIELGRQDERLIAGNKRFAIQNKWLISLTICSVSIIVTMTSIHGPIILKTIKLLF